MAQVEFDTARLGLHNIGIQLSILGKKRISICKTVGNNVPWAQLLQEKLTIGSCGEVPLGRHRSEICQDGQAGQSASLKNAIDRRPWSPLCIELPPIMAGLES